MYRTFFFPPSFSYLIPGFLFNFFPNVSTSVKLSVPVDSVRLYKGCSCRRYLPVLFSSLHFRSVILAKHVSSTVKLYHVITPTNVFNNLFTSKIIFSYDNIPGGSKRQI